MNIELASKTAKSARTEAGSKWPYQDVKLHGYTKLNGQLVYITTVRNCEDRRKYGVATASIPGKKPTYFVAVIDE